MNLHFEVLGFKPALERKGRKLTALKNIEIVKAKNNPNVWLSNKIIPGFALAEK
jgi:hypothetical protein